MNTSVLSNTIIKNLSIIPGILAFCTLGEPKKELTDPKSWAEALSITIDDEKINLNIALIISVDSTINNIFKQIKEQATFDLKKRGFKLQKINIYIKGIK